MTQSDDSIPGNGASHTGGSFTDLLIRPLYEDLIDTRGVVIDRVAKNHGYLLSENPCNICIKEVEENKFRFSGWNHTCYICGCYIEFREISKYIRVMGKGNRSMETLRENFKRYYHLKNRARFVLTDPADLILKKEESSE